MPFTSEHPACGGVEALTGSTRRERSPWPADTSEAVPRGGRGPARENAIAMAMNLPTASVWFDRLELFQSPIVDNPNGWRCRRRRRLSVSRGIAMARVFRAIFLGFIFLSSAGTGMPAGPIEDATAALERRDFATALQLLRPLAKRGNADAQMKVGFLYVTGEGVPQDYAEAAKWFHLAADQGQANAQCFLGLMYFEGRGVPREYVKAHMWLNLAAGGGIEDAAEYRDALTAKMTPAQIAKAQRLAREWKRGQK